MPGLSNEELRRRLLAHNYNVPPITGSTREILLKKLAKLDAENATKLTNGIRSKVLIDYSSAEDEHESEPRPGVARRRASTSSRNSNASSTLKKRTGGRINGFSKGENGANARKTNGSEGAKSKLINFSEEEEEESDEEGGCGDESEEDDDFEEEEDCLDEEDEDDDDLDEMEEDDEDEMDDLEDKGIQTSPALDLTNVSVNRSSLRFRGNATPIGGKERFASSTPAPNVKNTSSFITPTSPGASARFSYDSPLRRGIAANKQAYGSLSEVLASFSPPPQNWNLSGLSNRLQSSTSTASSSESNSASATPQEITQATPQRAPSSQQQVDSRKCSSRLRLTSQSISKLILVFAGLFFLLLSYKYANLRPSPEIAHRIPVCHADGSDLTQTEAKTCVTEDQVENLTLLFKDLVQVLETDGLERVCAGKSEQTSYYETGITVQEALDKISRSYKEDVDVKPVSNDYHEYDDTTNEQPESISRRKRIPENLLRSTMTSLLTLMQENASWGVKVLSNHGESLRSENDEEAEVHYEYFDFDTIGLVVPNLSINWKCWLYLKTQQIISITSILFVYALYTAIVTLLVFVTYRIHVWRQEKRLREHQDVFELVEQVLSMLVTQHQLTSGQQGGSSPGSGGGMFNGKPCLAVNHIRDQLIPPQDRKRKKHIWDKVVNYIRESESRVREESKTIYGEEHLVWQWIPDIHWSPMNLHGPNPYVVVSAASTFTPPSSTATPTSSGFLPLSHLHHRSPGSSNEQTPTSSHRSHIYSSPSSTSSPMASPSWQGSAFNTLNKNVAAPLIAPTSCLKVRHMFNHRQVNQPLASKSPLNSNSWVWQVKEEILQRCSSTQPPAIIFHIAVDLESLEGCVYIKAKNTEEAGKVFRTLHGQWYKGNLVTVKYLREERYFERFPDARHYKVPLKPNHL